MKVIAFTILDKEYGIEIKNVVQVISLKELTPIPQAPNFVEGITIWHGRIMPLISLHKRFGLKEKDPMKLDRVIIAKFYERQIGIIVDQFRGVLNLGSKNLESPGSLLQEASYLVGVGKIGNRLILLMDVERLLSAQERSEVEKMMVESEKKPSEEKSAKNTLRVLGFCLNDENYCVEIREAVRVFTPGLVTRVPNASAFIKGLANLHGTIIPLIDIRPFLGLTGGELIRTSKVIITEMSDGWMGLVVDKIFEAREIEKDSVQPPLATLQGKLLELTLGQVRSESGVMALLDLRKILALEELRHEGG
ncbi:MAG: chemotaxis protein CheW [Thermodesulfobacteriota bacterium]